MKMRITATPVPMTLSAVAAVLVPLLASPGAAASAPGVPYHQQMVITGPGVPPANVAEWCSDLVLPAASVPGNRKSPIVYVADATNKRVDRFNVATGKMLPPLGVGDFFTGPAGCPHFDFSREGPQGMVPVGQFLWVGNGDSRIQILNVRSGARVGVVNTGGNRRVDEGAYDLIDHLVFFTNPDETNGSPFASLINARTRKIITRVRVPGALGLEQPVWDPVTDTFFISIPQTKTRPGGEVAQINPHTGWTIRTIAAPAGCQPGGLALDPHARVLGIGCGNGPAVLMSLSGKVQASFPQVPGTDEVYRNPVSGRWFFGDFITPGCGVVGRSMKYLGTIPVPKGTLGFHACAAVHGRELLPVSGVGAVAWGADAGK